MCHAGRSVPIPKWISMTLDGPRRSSQLSLIPEDYFVKIDPESLGFFILVVG